MCGKDAISLSIKLLISGSPPRVREGHHTRRFINILTGITPACAGRTAICVVGVGHLQDHPRVCGKNLKRGKSRSRNEGSPPRVREGQIFFLKTLDNRRITPACAGRTSYNHRNRHISRDHPRVCGKDVLIICKSVPLPGSPPRVREGLQFPCGFDPSVRITPACAGRT